MDSLFTDKIGSLIFLIFGISLIIFRKQLVKLNLKIQYKKAKLKEIKDLELAKEIGLKPHLLKFQEMCYVIVGFIITIICLQELFLPKAGKYINSFMGLFVLSIFAVGGAIFVTFGVLCPFIWLNVDKYLKEKHPDYYRKAHDSSKMERWKMIKSHQQIDDPVLRKLQKKALIYTTFCFSSLFFICLFGLYTLIKITS
ncbi:MAG: hypothetical protein ACYSSI_14685 [Planctomycetota bacterium]|jgi:hypothetical protein